jgi:hypothetical protein
MIAQGPWLSLGFDRRDRSDGLREKARRVSASNVKFLGVGNCRSGDCICCEQQCGAKTLRSVRRSKRLPLL